jgi:hypothetical protein
VTAGLQKWNRSCTEQKEIVVKARKEKKEEGVYSAASATPSGRFSFYSRID